MRLMLTTTPIPTPNTFLGATGTPRRTVGPTAFTSTSIASLLPPRSILTRCSLTKGWWGKDPECGRNHCCRKSGSTAIGKLVALSGQVDRQHDVQQCGCSSFTRPGNVGAVSTFGAVHTRGTLVLPAIVATRHHVQRHSMSATTRATKPKHSG